MHRRYIALLSLFAILMTVFNSMPITMNTTQSTDNSNMDSSLVDIQSTNVLSTAYPEPKDISGNTYSAPHSGFSITSNSEFLALKASETWAGTGDASSPIVISGYNFTSSSSDLLSISNTDLYFTIEENFFRIPTENYEGISLSNVTNANITNNYFDKASHGAMFNDVNDTVIQDNHFTSLAGIFISAGQNNNITDNYYNTTDTAVFLYTTSTSYIKVYNNTFVGNTYGVYVWSAFRIEILHNYFTQTSINSIYLTQTTFGFNNITDNVIEDSVGSGLTGIYVSSYSHNNTIYRNNITNVTLSIRLSYADNNTVLDNSIENTTQAISVESSQWNRVYGNNISEVSDGFDSAFALYIYKAGNNTFHHNNITDTDNGVFIFQSGENEIYQHIISGIRSIGFNIMTGVLNSIYDNELSGGTTAIYIHTSSTNNTLSRNNLLLQNLGIQLRTTSHHNAFYQNTIVNATTYGIDSTTSSYLTIFNNTILNSGIRGINIEPSSYHVIAFNDLSNTGEYGIYLDTGLGSKIYNNTIKYHTSAGAYLISTNQHNTSFNTFANSTVGLALVLSTPGYVIGNTFANNSDTGLLLSASSGIPVVDNLFDNNGVYGLRISNSDGTTVENNTIRSGTQYGIAIESGSDVNSIRYNEISNNAMYGVWTRSGPNTIRMNNISGSSVGIYVDATTLNSIEYNFIDRNTDGIRLVDSDDITILLNTIYNNSQYGVYSESGFPEENTGNKIHNNTVISNGVYGVWLYAATRTTEVKWNDFINNTDHARDSNPSTYLNDWDQNFYDDAGPVPSYYDIIGINIRDWNPSPLPINPSRIHFMLPATISSPTTGSDYPSDITVTWSSAFDSDGHSITYDLYYSNNSGSNWYSLATGLTNNSLYWNTTTLSEGTEYQVRIVASDTIGSSQTSETGLFSIDPQAPRLGVVPQNFTVELSWDPMPVLNFSAFDTNPDWAY
ncbi:MAG: right-handed parallel beta-helix repeat-containing protein, partial [Candidatus Thorarchaeota archaeon]